MAPPPGCPAARQYVPLFAAGDGSSCSPLLLGANQGEDRTARRLSALVYMHPPLVHRAGALRGGAAGGGGAAGDEQPGPLLRRAGPLLRTVRRRAGPGAPAARPHRPGLAGGGSGGPGPQCRRPPKGLGTGAEADGGGEGRRLRPRGGPCVPAAVEGRRPGLCRGLPGGGHRPAPVRHPGDDPDFGLHPAGGRARCWPAGG